ncbi:MAG: phosphatidate cytidylyltransferase, partial [Clostridia bacterium]|nr:phosphatidate cytidylyltransferase [Clostridia bacterium]
GGILKNAVINSNQYKFAWFMEIFAYCAVDIFALFSLSALCIIANYEMLYNAAGIRRKSIFIGTGIYSAIAIFAAAGYTSRYLTFAHAAVYYVVFSAVISLVFHKEFSLKEISAFAGLPIIICYAFSSLEGILNHTNGIYYLLLMLNFSSVCDMGAYFTGVTLGKHKLCPEISPKKTVEGAIGGIVSSFIVAIILVFAFGFKQKILVTLLLTAPFCILGMVGDLFASVIKRGAGIKDYGNLIPGHGGVLDRVDSILMIAPVLYIFINLRVL